MPKYGGFSGPYFPVFGPNTEIYSANLRIQSEYRKVRTRKNSVFGHFSRSETEVNCAGQPEQLIHEIRTVEKVEEKEEEQQRLR